MSERRVVLVTGSTDGIGRAVARTLAAGGMKVIVHGRSKPKVDAAIAKLMEELPGGDIEGVSFDLGSLAAVRKGAGQILERLPQLHVLVNNAGIFASERVVTDDQLELTFAVNYLGPFLLTELLLPRLVASAAESSIPSRVVNVTSIAHTRGRIHADDLTLSAAWTGYAAYAQSKLAQVMHALSLAEQHAPDKVVAYSVHPGVISTKLLRQGFGPIAGASVETGAKTTVRLAGGETVDEPSGSYFSDGVATPPAISARDKKARESLWDASKRLAGCNPMADDPVDAIAGMIERGEDDAAFAQVRTHFGWPSGKEIATADLPRWLGLVAALASRRDAPQLTELANDAVRDPDSPDRLYDLGYALIDAGAPAIAASILWRCLALVGQSEEVVCELVAALESALAYDDAFAVLAEYPTLRQHSFLCRYLYAFNAAMSGRLDVARETAPQLEPDTPEHESMANAVVALIARADRVAGILPLDRLDLRGWHYVLGGGILLHQSPYGFDEPMHGRYAWLGDSYANLATGLARLGELVRGMQLECIYAPPGRDHEILSIAASKQLGLPLAPWPLVGKPAPGLVVVYNLADLVPADVVRLVERRPDQVLFAHATPWTVDNPICPDVTTLLYQSIVPPWGESMVVDPDTKNIKQAAPDARPSDVIADEILASPGLGPDELAADQPERYAALIARGWPLELGTRPRLFAGGPVPFEPLRLIV